MADFNWNAQSPLEKALVPGLHGEFGMNVGVTLEEVQGASLVQVMARRGKMPETVKATKKLLGIEPPKVGQVTRSRDIALVWSGPEQFIAVSSRPAQKEFALFAEAFAGIASLSDQSDGRCFIRVGGPVSRQALAKVSSLDLHDSVFPVDNAATTSIDHTAVNIWRDAPGSDRHAVFNLLVFTSFADSLWRTIADSALEYGVHTSAVRVAA